MKKIAVIGAGSWGTALAIVLADNGHDIKIWARRSEQIEEINRTHTNATYLPGIVLPSSIVGVTTMEEAVNDVEVVLLVVPTAAIRQTAKQLSEIITRPVTVIHASKGIELHTYKRISEMITESFAHTNVLQDVAVLSGPSHAEEVSERQITAVTASSKNIKAAELTQDLFMNGYFRVYTNEDLIGVEIGSALKNVIALGCGLINGLQMGDNTKAAVITRGLAEITRLGVALGANPLTFSGLSGLGDLIATCTSTHSRNYQAGYKIGEGKSVKEALDSMAMVVEGVSTTKAAYELASKLQVDMPITAALYEVLFEDLHPKEAATKLMGRVKRHEVEQF